MLDAYGRWLAEALHECEVELRDLLAVCSACNRSLHRERDKQCLARALVAELIQALHFKSESLSYFFLVISPALW